MIRCSVAPLLLLGISVSCVYAQTDDAVPTFGTTVVAPNGLVGDLYYMSPDSAVLPDFDKMVPVGRIYTTRLNIPTRDFSGGFPGVTSRIEWFAIDYNGRFWVENPGKYKFNLLSDDGSRLYIDGKLQIDNDGIHAATSVLAEATLTRGVHRLRLEYFQGVRYQLALVFSVQPPGGKWKTFDTNDFKPPSNTESLSEADRKAIEELQDEPSRKMRKSGKDQANEESAMEKLKASDLPHDFAFRSTVLHFPGAEKDGKENLSVAYEVPLGSLRPQVDNRTEVSTWRFLLIAVVRDTSGKVVDEMRTDVPFAVPTGQAKTVSGKYFTYAKNFSVSAGKYRVTSAVMDRESGKLTGVASEVEVGGSQNGVSMSSLVMVDHLQKATGSAGGVIDPLVYQGNRLVPMLSRNIASGEQRTIYFLARAKAAAEQPKLEIEFLVDGKSTAKQMAQMPSANEAGLIPMSFVAPAPAGHCELRLTAVQGASSSTESIAYEVAAAK